MEIETDPFDIKYIRLLAVLDGKLLAVPFRRNEESVKKYSVTFPTPISTLEYQVQFGFADGKTSLSKRFVADPHCVDAQLENTLSTAADFPSQLELLRKAADLSTKSQVLEYLMKTLDRIGEKPSPYGAETTE